MTTAKIILFGSIALLIAIAARESLDAQQQLPEFAVTITTVYTPKVDVFVTVTPDSAYVLKSAPALTPGPMVHLNGLLMTAGLDYTLAGAAITFTNGEIDPDETPIITILYWTTEKQ